MFDISVYTYQLTEQGPKKEILSTHLCSQDDKERYFGQSLSTVVEYYDSLFRDEMLFCLDDPSQL